MHASTSREDSSESRRDQAYTVTGPHPEEAGCPHGLLCERARSAYAASMPARGVLLGVDCTSMPEHRIENAVSALLRSSDLARLKAPP